MGYILFWNNSIYSDILILFEINIRHIKDLYKSLGTFWKSFYQKFSK